MQDDASLGGVKASGAEVARHAAQQMPRTLERLAGYLRVPAISCDPTHHPDVVRLSHTLRADLVSLGFSARVLHLEGALPLTCAERRDAGPNQPTLLILRTSRSAAGPRRGVADTSA